ncbi:MAG: GNAT family N-acetyltransferase [Bacteroidota bacterium]
MQIVERNKMDTERWDALVRKNNGSFFSLSCYLDQLAENWCVLVDENYQKGMALPYLNRLGQQMIYTPVFYRYAELFNFQLEEKEYKLLEKRFKFANLLVDKSEENSRFLFQTISENYELNERSKRMIKKFDKSTLEMKTIDDVDLLWGFVNEHLRPKIDSLNQKSMGNLLKLLHSLKQNGLLKVIAVFEGNSLQGGAFFVENDQHVLYLKSAFSEEAKKSGAMYKIVGDQIKWAVDMQRTFDFGGSRAENVRNFNLNFGAKDVYYSMMNWNNLPFWMKVVLKLKDRS